MIILKQLKKEIAAKRDEPYCFTLRKSYETKIFID